MFLFFSLALDFGGNEVQQNLGWPFGLNLTTCFKYLMSDICHRWTVV